MPDAPLPTTDPLFPELTERVLSGKCVPFIGAGMSRPMYPDWSGLISQLCDGCGVKTRVDDRGKQYSAMTLAGMAKAANGVAYASVLRQVFRAIDPAHRHHLLAKIPFPFYLTTNYDGLLLRALELRTAGAPLFSTYPNLYLLNQREREVFFLHGHIDAAQPNAELEVVLAQSDYDAAYGSSSLSAFLQQLLPMRSICFIGCSLQDEFLRGVFELCRAHRDLICRNGHPLRTRWFMLLDREADPNADWSDLGIEPVRYDRQNEGHQGLQDILTYWAQPPVARLRQLQGDEPVTYATNIEVPR